MVNRIGNDGLGVAAGAALALWLTVVGAIHAQGANCQEFLTPQQVIDNAGASPHVCAFDSVRNAAANTKLRHVLLYDWSAGGHSRTHTQRHMLRLARDYGFRLDRSQDSTYITASSLQGVDIVVINNSDGDAFQNSTSLQAIRNFVEVEGKAIFLIHAAAAFNPCPGEDLEDPECVWVMRALRSQFWRHMNHSENSRVRLYADSVLTGEVPPNALRASIVPAEINHGRMNQETRRIFESLPLNGPSGPLADRPYIWEGLWDEWYAYQNDPRLEGTRVMEGVTYGPINILLSLDESSGHGWSCCAGGSAQVLGNAPVSWTRKMGNGLSAYNNAGHGDVYTRTRLVDSVVVNDSLMEKYNWRLMKYLARDFVGCMAPEDANYNPQATVLALTSSDAPCPCVEAANCAITSVRPQMSGQDARVFVERVAGGFRIDLADAGRHRVSVLDALGREVFTTAAQGGREAVAIPVSGRGVYFLRVDLPDGGMVSERIKN